MNIIDLFLFSYFFLLRNSIVPHYVFYIVEYPSTTLLIQTFTNNYLIATRYLFAFNLIDNVKKPDAILGILS